MDTPPKSPASLYHSNYSTPEKEKGFFEEPQDMETTLPNSLLKDLFSLMTDLETSKLLDMENRSEDFYDSECSSGPSETIYNETPPPTNPPSPPAPPYSPIGSPIHISKFHYPSPRRYDDYEDDDEDHYTSKDVDMGSIIIKEEPLDFDDGEENCSSNELESEENLEHLINNLIQEGGKFKSTNSKEENDFLSFFLNSEENDESVEDLGFGSTASDDDEEEEEGLPLILPKLNNSSGGKGIMSSSSILMDDDEDELENSMENLKNDCFWGTSNSISDTSSEGSRKRNRTISTSSVFNLTEITPDLSSELKSPNETLHEIKSEFDSTSDIFDIEFHRNTIRLDHNYFNTNIIKQEPIDYDEEEEEEEDSLDYDDESCNDSMHFLRRLSSEDSCNKLGGGDEDEEYDEERDEEDEEEDDNDSNISNKSNNNNRNNFMNNNNNSFNSKKDKNSICSSINSNISSIQQQLKNNSLNNNNHHHDSSSFSSSANPNRRKTKILVPLKDLMESLNSKSYLISSLGPGKQVIKLTNGDSVDSLISSHYPHFNSFNNSSSRNGGGNNNNKKFKTSHGHGSSINSFNSNSSGNSSSSSSSSNSNNNNNKRSQKKTTVHHNNNERMRRVDLRNSFDNLKKLIPAIAKTKASKVEVLRRAHEFINNLKNIQNKLAAEENRLKAKNELLKQKLLGLNQNNA